MVDDNRPQEIFVREFDQIICNHEDYARQKKWVHSLCTKNFNQLKDFISSATKDSSDEEILNFFQITSSKRLGYVITISNYVGVIELPDGFKIQIMPKIDMSKQSDEKVEEDILLRMIQSVVDPTMRIYSTAKLRTRNKDVLEVFISLFIDQVQLIVKQGLLANYFTVEENSRVFKGKLLTNQHIRNNLVHKERFYVQHDVFGIDCAENRILKATINLLKKKTRDYVNINRINQLLPYFSQVKDIYNYQREFLKISISRNNVRYWETLRWCKIFLNGETFSITSGAHTSNSILFKMDVLYESYVAQCVKKLIRRKTHNWSVRIQDESYSLFDFPKHIFNLRPDIVLFKKKQQSIILDTKWKRLDSHKKNYGIKQSDMYQMYAYAKKYGVSDVYVLYPFVKGFNSQKINFRSNDGVNIFICLVDLNDIYTSLEEIINLK